MSAPIPPSDAYWHGEIRPAHRPPGMVPCAGQSNQRPSGPPDREPKKRSISHPADGIQSQAPGRVRLPEISFFRIRARLSAGSRSVPPAQAPRRSDSIPGTESDAEQYSLSESASSSRSFPPPDQSGFPDSLAERFDKRIENVVDDGPFSDLDLRFQTHTRQQRRILSASLEFARNLQARLVGRSHGGFARFSSGVGLLHLFAALDPFVEGVLGDVDHLSIQSSALLERERIQFDSRLVAEFDPADVLCRDVHLGLQRDIQRNQGDKRFRLLHRRSLLERRQLMNHRVARRAQLALPVQHRRFRDILVDRNQLPLHADMLLHDLPVPVLDERILFRQNGLNLLTVFHDLHILLVDLDRHFQKGDLRLQKVFQRDDVLLLQIAHHLLDFSDGVFPFLVTGQTLLQRLQGLFIPDQILVIGPDLLPVIELSGFKDAELVFHVLIRFLRQDKRLVISGQLRFQTQFVRIEALTLLQQLGIVRFRQSRIKGEEDLSFPHPLPRPDVHGLDDGAFIGFHRDGRPDRGKLPVRRDNLVHLGQTRPHDHQKQQRHHQKPDHMHRKRRPLCLQHDRIRLKLFRFPQRFLLCIKLHHLRSPSADARIPHKCRSGRLIPGVFRFPPVRLCPSPRSCWPGRESRAGGR